MVTGVQEGLQIQNQCRELGAEVSLRVETDSAAAKMSAEKTGALHMKHMQLRMYFLKSLVEQKLIAIDKVSTLHNAVDVLTKIVGEQQLSNCLQNLPMLVRVQDDD